MEEEEEEEEEEKGKLGILSTWELQWQELTFSTGQQTVGK